MREYEQENYVAHYTNTENALKYILPSNELKLSTAGTVNDPYENKMDWFDCDPSTQPIGSICDCLDQKDQIRPLLENHIKLFCVTQYEGGESLYYAIPSMWSHYGDKHKGYV